MKWKHLGNCKSGTWVNKTQVKTILTDYAYKSTVATQGYRSRNTGDFDGKTEHNDRS